MLKTFDNVSIKPLRKHFCRQWFTWKWISVFAVLFCVEHFVKHPVYITLYWKFATKSFFFAILTCKNRVCKDIIDYKHNLILGS